VSDEVRVLDAAALQDAISDAPAPVLVDFWGPNCAPCVGLSRAIEQIAEENGTETRFGKVNVDEHPDLAERYEVRSVPTVVIFRDGEPVKRLFGAKNKRQLLQALSDARE
jgi:thioredoxin 1